MTSKELNEKELNSVSGGASGDLVYKCSKSTCTYTCTESTLPPQGICPRCGNFLVEA